MQVLLHKMKDGINLFFLKSDSIKWKLEKKRTNTYVYIIYIFVEKKSQKERYPTIYIDISSMICKFENFFRYDEYGFQWEKLEPRSLLGEIDKVNY